MKDYVMAAGAAGAGHTPSLCQQALCEMLTELFKGRKFIGQEGKKALKVFSQDLPVPVEIDVDADTNEAPAPYIVVQMGNGAINSTTDPQEIDFSLIICCYDTSLTREGFKDVVNIKETIIQRLCSAPYFGGCFTVLIDKDHPLAWAIQEDDTRPYYFGACNLTVTAPTLTQDTILKELL